MSTFVHVKILCSPSFGEFLSLCYLYNLISLVIQRFASIGKEFIKDLFIVLDRTIFENILKAPS